MARGGVRAPRRVLVCETAGRAVRGRADPDGLARGAPRAAAGGRLGGRGAPGDGRARLPRRGRGRAKLQGSDRGAESVDRRRRRRPVRPGAREAPADAVHARERRSPFLAPRPARERRLHGARREATRLRARARRPPGRARPVPRALPGAARAGCQRWTSRSRRRRTSSPCARAAGSAASGSSAGASPSSARCSTTRRGARSSSSEREAWSDRGGRLYPGRIVLRDAAGGGAVVLEFERLTLTRTASPPRRSARGFRRDARVEAVPGEGAT